MKTALLTLALLALFALNMAMNVGCATNPHRAVELDTKIERVSPISQNSRIGVKEGNIIYQKNVLLGEEVRNATIAAHEMEAKIYGGPRYYDNNGLIGVLKMCRAQISGMTDGKLQWTEKRDYVIPEENIQMGIDESGKLAGLTEEFLRDRLDRYRSYKRVLEQRAEEIETKIAACQSEVAHMKQSRTIASEE